MSKYKLLDILYSDDDWYLPDNIPRLVPKTQSSAPSSNSEKDNDEDIIDLTQVTSTEKTDEDINPKIITPDESQTIEISPEEPIDLEQADTFDWDNPASKSLILDMQLKQESEFNPNAVGAAGEQGMAQFMPDTWKWLVDKGWVNKEESAFDVESALKAQQA